MIENDILLLAVTAIELTALVLVLWAGTSISKTLGLKTAWGFMLAGFILLGATFCFRAGSQIIGNLPVSLTSRIIDAFIAVCWVLFAIGAVKMRSSFKKLFSSAGQKVNK